MVNQQRSIGTSCLPLTHHWASRIQQRTTIETKKRKKRIKNLTLEPDSRSVTCSVSDRRQFQEPTNFAVNKGKVLEKHSFQDNGRG
ncbi:hypothetical protein BaRGS_00028423 [Batillaria attramentaria]|uniref:Uncharacterized protein n=1 Tax=Batillaria attramentaria TaxID=370345 RepID=A0ABD0K0D3_9CAEN